MLAQLQVVSYNYEYGRFIGFAGTEISRPVSLQPSNSVANGTGGNSNYLRPH